MNVLSLFAGIGGLELGLERAGMTTVGQVEIDPFCRRVLAKHWPEVPKHDDVRTAIDWWNRGTACDYCPRSQGWHLESFASDYAVTCRRCRGTGRRPRPAVDVVCGGFPCQPFSHAGNQLGIADERWGWPWFADVVRSVAPRYVLVENVPALFRDADAFGWMLGDLARLGFDAEWGVLSACAVGAPHTRERLFVLAHRASDDGEQQVHLPAAMAGGRAGSRAAGGQAWPVGWLPEPDVGRVAHGVPKRVVAPRLHALGNAVVPDVGEHVGRLIVTAELARLAS